jgi:AcrR family transcriptional regulator
VARPKIYDESLKRQLISLTAEAFADGGPEAVSLRALARDAGTSTTAIYTIFGSKDDLLAALLDAASASLAAAQQAVPRTEHALRDFAEHGRAYRAWALEHPDLYHVMFGRGVVAPGARPDALESSMGPLMAAVRRCIAEGVLRDVEPRLAALSIWSAVHGLVSLEIAGYVVPADHVLEEHLVASALYWLPPGLLPAR